VNAPGADSPMRLVFFGSGEFGLPTLEALTRSHEVALIVTQPDRPAGRNRQLTATPIGQFASQRTLPVVKPPSPDEPAAVDRIRAAQADAFIVIAYGHKISGSLIGGTFAINLHASLLPKYRGAAPIQWAIINGERETGLSVITLARRMDAGEILAQTRTAIDPRETAGELHDRLAAMGPAIVLDVLREHQAGALRGRMQDESLATRAPKLSKSDGTVRFDQPADAVRNRIHGLTPWPGCAVRFNGNPLLLLRAEVADSAASGRPPGCVLDDLSIACHSGAIRLLEVQPPGKRAMSFSEYCNGHDVRPGWMATPA
jgi:methionyl-tRNA formyltransferase